jgi:poly [ADP-ribose] polymerase
LLQSDSGGKEYYVWFRWGRVGVVGQSKLETYGGNVSSAKNSFESKFRSKTLNLWSQRDQFQHYPGKYDLLERDYGGDDEDGEDEEEDKGKSLIKSSSGKQIKPPASDLPSPVQQLIQLIFDLNMMRQAMVEIGYDGTFLSIE